MLLEKQNFMVVLVRFYRNGHLRLLEVPSKKTHHFNIYFKTLVTAIMFCVGAFNLAWTQEWNKIKLDPVLG